ncbi:hypothetical protein PPL_04450 [Heterostelium album PN500]|uniref:Uncharacterized protein n=1 Tax=Heterostelium pallidum (strain ATCC 26659 / Pp 5 / PN500) TaxID=670386 RepID=D3B7L2_HETP5|nr:hypothetical protein PPL_04450 [Heterostelium album PN500]EFA82755.1 hypothetical protein PPL_04450 [Heterostelium album PN500]|eukprot:XP_020434872.1 hypothetical protein PPL_04450 [Heterostelium album PN500]
MLNGMSDQSFWNFILFGCFISPSSTSISLASNFSGTWLIDRKIELGESFTHRFKLDAGARWNYKIFYDSPFEYGFQSNLTITSVQPGTMLQVYLKSDNRTTEKLHQMTPINRQICNTIVYDIVFNAGGAANAGGDDNFDESAEIIITLDTNFATHCNYDNGTIVYAGEPEVEKDLLLVYLLFSYSLNLQSTMARLFSMSTAMTAIHFLLAILLFATSIVVFTRTEIHFNGVLLLLGILIWGSNDSNYFTGVMSLLFMLFGIAGIGLGGFSAYDPPRPLLGPEDFVPYGQKSVSLASQQDSLEDGLSSSSSSAIPPIVSQQPTFSL